MNRQQVKLVIASLLSISATTLFYYSDFSFNYLIYTLLSFFVSLELIPNCSIKRRTLIFLPLVATSTMLMFYSQAYSKSIWVLNYFVIWSILSTPRLSLIHLSQACMNIIEAPRAEFLEREKSPTSKQTLAIRSWIFPLSICFIFVCIYSNANPLVYEFISEISLPKESVNFAFISIYHFILLFGLIFQQQLPYINKLKTKTPSIEQQQEASQEEIQSALLTFGLLSALLLVVNLIDILHLSTGSIPQGMTYADYVHQGFFSLNFSLFLAIVTILYFFRSNLNFISPNSWLWRVTFLWIILNIILAFITVYKNYLYVELYGLTYKRILVFVASLCFAIGLYLCLTKLQKRHSLWNFVNRSVLCAWVLAISLNFLPFDYLICQYNIHYAKRTDIRYLLNLANPHFPLIKKYAEENHPGNNKLLKKIEMAIEQTKSE